MDECGLDVAAGDEGGVLRGIVRGLEGGGGGGGLGDCLGLGGTHCEGCGL